MVETASNSSKCGLLWHVDIPIPTVKKVFSSYEIVHLKPGAIIFFASDKMEYIYYLNKGIIRYYIKNGKRTKMIYWRDNCIINNFLLLIKDYFFEIQAVTKVELARMPVDQFQKKLQEDPNFFQEVIIIESNVLNNSINQLQSLCFNDANQRIDILMNDFQNYNISMKDSMILLQNLSQGEIADALALHPVTISKSIKTRLSNYKIK
ncbi:Crp/Fnr family transcriptional regulator [Candidatus Formimonas warabiya]|uniref:Cyclic nucleotide-binding domain-containing protein n=1 Tax=Formimonas warabiya TaxID=1761012 RepID=A0A3G1KQV9_FORW1|nr:Crp/Fnr family transcriptional regulator [Candidatus Formimonas warabiya]ATW24853.1 hypothetical protein DCMF_08765 [Candidatus Formimonas warabiya]